MHHMDHKEWLDQLVGADSYRTAAAKVGVDQSTLSRQLTRRGVISPEYVIALARAYGRRAGDELVVTGYLAPGDLEGVGIDSALRAATNRQLLEEIERRMESGAGSVFGEPIGSIDDTRSDLDLAGDDIRDDREDDFRDGPDAAVHNLPMRPDGALDINRMHGAASRREMDVYPDEVPDEGL